MKNIILIGFMGCGKTSVGTRLAEHLGIDFLDTDQMIVESQGHTINEIFETDGEKAFRKMETDCLKKLMSRQGAPFVLSVGGGLPMKEENRALLKQVGTVVFLKASPDLTFRRLRNDKTRPLLQAENPRGRIMDLMAARKKYYEAAADYVVEVDGLEFEDIIEKIENWIGACENEKDISN